MTKAIKNNSIGHIWTMESTRLNVFRFLIVILFQFMLNNPVKRNFLSLPTNRQYHGHDRGGMRRPDDRIPCPWNRPITSST
jgi:hypothetical protein